jgi:KilA-N domain
MLKRWLRKSEPVSKTKKAIIEVQGMSIAVLNQNDQDYISLTDIARYRNSQEPFAIINNWMRGRSTVEFLGLWEKLSNPGFKPLEFERFRNEAGSNYFVLSPQRWIEATQAIGITSKSGRYGGTYAHRDIAFVANIEGMNAEFIHLALPPGERLKRLNQIAIRQMQTLTAASNLALLSHVKGVK